MITSEMALAAVTNEIKAGNFDSVINTVRELLKVVERRGEMNDRLLSLNNKLLNKLSCGMQ